MTSVGVKMATLAWSTILLAIFITVSQTDKISDDLFNKLDSELIDLEFHSYYNFSDLNVTSFADHPHAHMNVVQLIEYYKYAVENHTIETRDGYILELHRITGNQSRSSPIGKPAVLLQHGIICSSMEWVILGPNKSLAFLLADAGYDVWIGNNRGNRYCRNHKTMSVKDADFWDFSWHEIGKNDLPSLIDYIIETTKNEKIFYIGHSQGATVFFVLLSEHPEYNDKIKAMVALAPVTFSSHMKSPLYRLLAKHASEIHLIMQLIGQNEFQPGGELFKWLTSKVCDKNIPTNIICTNIIFLMCGYDKDQLDLELLPAFMAHTPAGSSTKQFVHFAQLVKSGYFRQYDYGIVKNLIKYRHIKPPSYNLKNVKVPVSVHYSVNDWLTSPEDVKELFSQLPNPIGRFRVPFDKFNHLDFVWAKDVKTLLNDKVINIISRY